MIIYSFLITLKNQRNGKIEHLNIDSTAEDYLKAWQEACETAWARLNEHDTYWYIETIKHCL